MLYKTSEKQRDYQRECRQTEQGKEVQRKASRKYQQTVKGKEARKKSNKRYHQKNSERLNEDRRRVDQETREEAIRRFGGHCEKCGSGENLEFHKKDGQPHAGHTHLRATKNPEQFRLLCKECHETGHKLARDILKDMS